MKTRIVLISDTHGQHNDLNVPEGDILIHAGDFCNMTGDLEQVRSFNFWLSKLPHKHRVVVAGNHDFCFQSNNSAAREVLSSAVYLQDEAIEILGLKIYGSPWQPWFHDWAFNLQRGKALADVWDKIPEQSDILVTHTPPYGILDATRGGQHVGCEELEKRVKELSLKLHVFGHIHESYGRTEISDTIFVNASACNGRMQLRNPPLVVEI